MWALVGTSFTEISCRSPCYSPKSHSPESIVWTSIGKVAFLWIHLSSTAPPSVSLQICRRGDDKGRKRKIAMVAVPAASDLLATALAAIGIMYIPASVWQMLRGRGLICSNFV